MRSYWEHLKTQERKEGQDHPHFRASALFPVIQNEGLSTRLIFLGYWLVKRNIASIGNVITLRDNQGQVLSRTYQEITLPKCYRIELQDFVKGDFEGSLEVEFFSSKPLIFPFPAVSVNYYGPNFSSVVHTAERVYNDFEDLKRNQKALVKESGFDLHDEPFFALVNGPLEIQDAFDLEVINSQNETMPFSINLHLAPYETRFFYPGKIMDLKKFLGGKTGTIKIRVTLPWVFPRLIAGNLENNAMILTHTYYDESSCSGPGDFWIKEGDYWHSAALMLPLNGGFDNSISFYPIYSPSPFKIAAETRDQEGKIIAKDDNFFTASGAFERKAIAIPKGSGLCSLRLIAKETSETPIPARIKVAINIGGKLPCNICTNLQPYYPNWESKKRSFKWLPLLFDQKGAKTIIMNSSPLKDYKDAAEAHLVFYRESDDKTLVRDIAVPPHGFVVLDEEDRELSEFLQGKIGWVTVESGNPYLTTYYFVFHESGIVGGDHGY